jgi:hypothetical protein
MWPSLYPRVIGRDRNVVVVDFAGRPEPPAPQFPGANALRVPAAAPESELRAAAAMAGASCRHPLSALG